MQFWNEKSTENGSQNGPQKHLKLFKKPSQKRDKKKELKSDQKKWKIKPVSTWNGKRGVVIDIVCVWVCSACTSGSLRSWGVSFLLNFDYIFSLGRGLPFTLMFIATGLHFSLFWWYVGLILVNFGIILRRIGLHIGFILVPWALPGR